MSLSRITLVLVALALCCAPVAGQDQAKERRRKALLEGTHVFRRMLHDKGLTAHGSVRELLQEPERSLLVVLGDLECLDLEGTGLKAFLARGGAALVASDRAIRDRNARSSLIEATGVSISGATVAVLIGPHGEGNPEAYNNLSHCPILASAEGADPALLEESMRLVANVPSLLNVHNPNFSPVLMLPRSSYLEGEAPRAVPNALFGVSARHGENGRLLVFADHSLFINEMMLPKATNNVEFTSAAIDWLKGDGRDRVLFLEEGNVQTKLDIPLKSVELPIWEALELLWQQSDVLAQAADRKLARLDRSGALGANLAGGLTRRLHIPWSSVVLALVVVATLVAFGFSLYRLGFVNRFNYDWSSKPLTQEAGGRLPGAPLAGQRVEAMVAAGDARDVLRRVARDWFVARDVAPPADAGAELPGLRLAGGWWARWGLWARLGRLWRLAAGAYPSAVPPGDLAWWQREMEDLAARHERGEWGAPPAAPGRRMDDQLAA